MNVRFASTPLMYFKLKRKTLLYMRRHVYKKSSKHFYFHLLIAEGKNLKFLLYGWVISHPQYLIAFS